MSSILIAPSILSADFSRLGEELENITQSGADRIHVDVMDGHFVPNITIGPAVVKALRPHTSLPLDVHLMTTPEALFLEEFARAGADSLTFHVELPDIRKNISKVKSFGKEVGLSLRPQTNVEELIPYLHLLDYVLVMTVNPGFGGQMFMPEMLEKIQALAGFKRGNSFRIAVDGGINGDNALMVQGSGADILVAGTAVFEGGRDFYASNIQRLRR